MTCNGKRDLLRPATSRFTNLTVTCKQTRSKMTFHCPSPSCFKIWTSITPATGRVLIQGKSTYSREEFKTYCSMGFAGYVTVCVQLYCVSCHCLTPYVSACMAIFKCVVYFCFYMPEGICFIGFFFFAFFFTWSNSERFHLCFSLLFFLR
jgi:hypothetical protein